MSEKVKSAYEGAPLITLRRLENGILSRYEPGLYSEAPDREVRRYGSEQEQKPFYITITYLPSGL